MKVLLVHDYGTPTGGAELQVLQLRHALRAAGHDARLFSSRASLVPGELLAEFNCYGTTSNRWQVLNQTANPAAAFALRRALRDFRPDVVHVRMFLAQLSPLVLPLLTDIPAVYHAVWYKTICPAGTKLLPDGQLCTERAGLACLRHRCKTPQSWIVHMAQRTLWLRWRHVFDVVLGLSGAVKTRLESEGIGPVEVVPNPVVARPLRAPLTSPPTVGFAGRLVREKGVDLLLRAFATVRSELPEARLLIAGHGPERDTLTSLAARLGVSDAASFLGHLPRDELDRRFECAWIQAVPGRWEEPFGNIVTESMIRGTAVVATAIGGPAEIVRDGVTGLLIPPNDIDALADALRSLLTDRARAEGLGRAGHDVARREYTESATVKRLESVYARARARNAAARQARHGARSGSSENLGNA